MKEKFFLNSVRFKMVFAYLIITVPLIAMLISNNTYAIDVVRNQVAQSNKNMVSLYMDQIDRNLEEVDKYLYNQVAQNMDLYNLELSSIKENERYYKSKISLSNLLAKDINNYSQIDMFFIYSSINDDLWATHYSNASYQVQQKLEEDIYKLIQKDISEESYQNDIWYVYKAETEYYIFHLIKIDDFFIGAWVNANNLLVPLNLVDLGDGGRALLSTVAYEPMDSKEYIIKNEIELDYGDDLYKLTGINDDYLVIGDRSSMGEFSLLAVINNDSILEKLPFIQKLVSSVLPIAAFALALTYLLLLRNIILVPIKRIVGAMRNVNNLEVDYSIPEHKTSTEFKIMNDTFNNMIAQIKSLKIRVYEEKISKQNAELRHLQLQIKPHFFLNTLNVIYELAQLKDYDLIKEMSKCLIEYFRFMFRSNIKYVLLEEEIMHVVNYLKIQKLRFHDFMEYNIELDESIRKYFVPPLIVQSFVENSIKYAVNMDDTVKIIVEVELAGELKEPMVLIKISDTGQGFSKDVLERLQKSSDMFVNENGENVGIWNAIHRLDILYQGKARIEFLNSSIGGAVVKIYLPIKQNGGM